MAFKKLYQQLLFCQGPGDASAAEGYCRHRPADYYSPRGFTEPKVLFKVVDLIAEVMKSAARVQEAGDWRIRASWLDQFNQRIVAVSSVKEGYPDLLYGIEYDVAVPGSS